MIRFRFFSSCAAILILVSACTQKANVPQEAVEQALPISDSLSRTPGSIAPSFNRYNDTTFLQWLEPADSGYRMMLSHWIDTRLKWSLPREIFRHKNIMANAHDIPGMATVEAGGWRNHYLWWHENSPAGEYKYNIRVNTNLEAPVGLHPDIPAGEHAFVSAAPTQDGRLAFAWLQNHPDPHAPDSVHAPTQLCFKIFPAPQAEDPGIVDSMVCDCCPTEMVATESGLVLAYRDRSPDEIRDIKVRVFTDGKWSQAIEVGQERWKMNGCPVNGAALAAFEDQLDLVWFTGENGNSRIRHAQSKDQGWTWVIGPDLPAILPMGQLDLAKSAAGTWASWVEQDTAHGGTRIVLQSISKAEDRFVIARLPGDAPAYRPMLAIVNGMPVITWANKGIHTCIIDPGKSPKINL